MNFKFDDVIIREIEKEDKVEFVFENLPNNLSHTFGNFCRRVLLDYSSAISLVGLKIISNGAPVRTEFSRLEGSNRTTLDLINSLKNINLTEKFEKAVEDENFISNLDDIFSLELNMINKTDEEIIFTADSLEKKSNILISNPSLYLTTISPKKEIIITTYWRKNTGYHSAEEQKNECFAHDENNEIIVLDSSYSPFKFSEITFEVKKEIVEINKEKEVLYLIFKKSNFFDAKVLLKDILLNSSNFFLYVVNKISENEEEK